MRKFKPPLPLRIIAWKRLGALGTRVEENFVLITNCSNNYLLWLRISNVFHKKVSCFNATGPQEGIFVLIRITQDFSNVNWNHIA